MNNLGRDRVGNIVTNNIKYIVLVCIVALGTMLFVYGKSGDSVLMNAKKDYMQNQNVADITVTRNTPFTDDDINNLKKQVPEIKDIDLAYGTHVEVMSDTASYKFELQQVGAVNAPNIGKTNVTLNDEQCYISGNHVELINTQVKIRSGRGERTCKVVAIAKNSQYLFSNYNQLSYFHIYGNQEIFVSPNVAKAVSPNDAQTLAIRLNDTSYNESIIKSGMEKIQSLYKDDNTVQIKSVTNSYAYSQLSDDEEKYKQVGNIISQWVFWFTLLLIVMITIRMALVKHHQLEKKLIEEKKVDIQSIQMDIVFEVIASVVGTVLGLAFGGIFFSMVYSISYSKLLQFNAFKIGIEWNQLFMSSLFYILAILIGWLIGILSIWYHVYRSDKKAEVAQSKKWTFDKMPLWSMISLQNKMMLRSFFRQKTKWIMGVVVVLFGATITTGFLSTVDALSQVSNMQYRRVQNYDSKIIIEDGKMQDVSILHYRMKDRQEIHSYTGLYEQNVDITYNDNATSATLFVPENNELFGDYVIFKNVNPPAKDEVFNLVEKKVIITSKMAQKLNVKVDDKLTLKLNGENKEFTIAGITQNYINDYIYINSQLFSQAQQFKYNTVVAKRDVNADEYLKTIRQQSSVQSVYDTNEDLNMYQTRYNALNAILMTYSILVFVLVGLSLYISYDLTIGEEYKNIRTLRLLGFGKNEIKYFIHRGNLVGLIIIGVYGSLFGQSLYSTLTKALSTRELQLTIRFPFYIIFVTLILFILIHWIAYILAERKIKNIHIIE